MPGEPRRAPRFLPHILHTKSSTAPIWDFLMVRLILEKNITATK